MEAEPLLIKSLLQRCINRKLSRGLISGSCFVAKTSGSFDSSLKATKDKSPIIAMYEMKIV